MSERNIKDIIALCLSVDIKASRIYSEMAVLTDNSELIRPNPEDEYESHLKRFIDALNQFGKTSPEMELLGETLQRLWLENRNLARQSLYDNLTGTLNRRGFFDSIKPLSYLAQRSNLMVGIMMIDIDNFKTINDSYGHRI